MGEIIKLREAVTLIWETVKTNNDQGELECPYVFIAGSGISAPEILTAGGIIQQCQERVRELYKEDSERLDEVFQRSESFLENSAKYYSYWFEQAYKNKKNRQQYLKDIIINARISTSNLLLAQILNSKKVATTVITPNFDNHLQKSLNLLGNYDVFSANNVLDNIALNKNSENIQIMHVHGTYEFYDCCNLENEIVKIANEQGIKTTAGTIEEFLKSQSPIVIGYSGWEDDVIMSKLKERIEYAALPYKWLWFCFTRKDYDTLPDWLKNSDDVNFVLPDLKMDMEKHIEEKEENPILPAEDVLNALITKFKFEAPFLFSNPIQYYIDLIDGFLPENIEIFPIRSWKRRLDKVEKYLGEIDKQIILLDAAAAKKDIVEITKILKEINYNFLLYDDLEHILKGVLLPLLNNKNRIENTEELFGFLDAIISLLSIKVKEINAEKLNLFLGKTVIIIQYNQRKIEKENLVKLCDKIIDICDKKKDCKILCLSVLGIKSDYVDKNQGKDIRKQIIEWGKNELDNENIAKLVLLASFKEIREQGSVSDYCKNIMISAKEQHNDNKKLQEIYYSLIVDLMDRKIKLDISAKELINEIKEKGLSSELLLKAYRVYCDLEKDSNKKIKIAMDAVELYDVEDLKSCGVCIDYALLLKSIVTEKIDLEEKIEHKYIKRGIDLCHKDGCSIVSQIVIFMLVYYIDTVENQYEKKDLCEKAIAISKKGKFYQDWIFFHDRYFECIEKKEQENYLEKNNDYGRFRETRERMSMAIDAYTQHNVVLCKDMLLAISERFDEMFEGKYNPALINICFMMRRGEISEIDTPILDMMDQITEMDNDAFFHINKALVYIAQGEYEKEREEIRKIEYYLEEAVQWWNREDVVGREEKTVVLCLLILENKIETDIEKMEFIESNIDSISLPNEIKQEVKRIKIK